MPLADPQDQQSTQPVDPTNYVKAAFHWQYNWISLAGAAAFALISGTALPILLAAGLELMYLAIVPQSSRFRRLVRSWPVAQGARERAGAGECLNASPRSPGSAEGGRPDQLR